MKEKIFIMIADSDLEETYEHILKCEGYVTKNLGNRGYIVHHQVNENNFPRAWQYTQKMIEDVVNFHPHIIVCDISTYTTSGDKVLEFLQKIRKAFSKNEYPLNLVAIPSYWGTLRGVSDFTDEIIISPIDPNNLLKTIKNLLK